MASVSALIPLSSVVVGAFLAFLFSRLGARAEAKREHARWLTERRFEAYRDFLATADKWATRATGPTDAGPAEPGQDFYDEMTAVEAAIELVGPQEAADAMSPIRSALLHLQDEREPGHKSAAMFYWEKQRAFTAVAQKHLGYGARTPSR